MGIFDFLNKDKSKTAEIPVEEEQKKSEQDLANIARKGGEDIAEKLEEIRFISKNEVIPEETLATYGRIARALATYLRKMPTTASDLEFIDKYIMELVHYLKISVDMESAPLIDENIKMINMAISELRTDTSDMEEDTAAELIGKRQERLKHMCEQAKYAVQMFQLDKSIEESKRVLEENIQKFEEAKQNYLEYQEKNPHIVDLFNEVIANHLPVPVEVKEFDLLKRTTINTHNQKKQQENKIANLKSDRESFRTAYESSRSILSKPDILHDVNFVKEAEERYEQLLEDMKASEERTIAFDDALSRFSKKMDQFYSSKRIQDHMIATSLRMKEIMEAEQQTETMKRAAEARVRREKEEEARLKAELEAKLEQEQQITMDAVQHTEPLQYN